LHLSIVCELCWVVVMIVEEKLGLALFGKVGLYFFSPFMVDGKI